MKKTTVLVNALLVLALAPAARGQAPVQAKPDSDSIAPNENLVADGLAAVPKSLAQRVGTYAETRSAGFVDWHPTKREILIATRFGDVAQIHQVAMPMGAREQLTFYPEPVGNASWRPKKGDGFVFSKDVGGGEWFQLFWRDGKTGAITMITDGKSRNTRGGWSADGKWLAYQSTKRTGKDSDVWVVDPADPKTARLALEVEGGGWGAADWSPDGKNLLVGEYKSVNESRFWLVDVATGTKEPLTPESKDQVSWGFGRFSKDGKAVYFTTDEGSEFSRLVSMDVASRKRTVLTPNLAWDVNSADLSDDGKKIAYVVNEGGAETLHVMDLATKKELPVPKPPVGTIGGYSWRSNSREIAFALNSARSPSDVWSFDTTQGAAAKLVRWTKSETGGLDTSGWAEPKKVAWKSFDGLEISGWLYMPPARFTGPRPVVVNIHGGPEGQSQPGFLGRNNFFINDLGVAILFPNVRGSTGFGKTFVKLDNGEKREDSVKDIGALLDWIATQKDLDKDRVMVTGGSYGGYMTLASMTNYNDRFRCAVDVVGISNFVTFLEKTEAYRRDLRRVEYGDERDSKMRETLQAISPLTNAAKITKPMFIVQGKNDPRVPYAEAEQMTNAIKKNGGPVWFLTALDEGHGFQKKKNVDFQFYATVKFVEDHLLK